jgi:CheY-like chemotaxis protein
VRHGKQEPRPAPPSVPAAAPAPAPAPPRNPDAKRILIVDDDPEVVEVLRRFFEKTPQDYAVQTVTNGEDAIAALTLEPPDLVLLDLNMPGVNGLEVLKHIDRSIPVMIVSGNVDATPADALKFGAFAYLPKPFDLMYVEQLVPLALTQRRTPKVRVAESGV